MASPLPTVFLNGKYLPLADAHISPLDRGFLFGDAVYEVVPVYKGKPFLLDAHLDRLQHSLEAIRLENPFSRSKWQEILGELIDQNGGGTIALYFQISRGADAGRDHPFPANVPLTVFAMAQPLQPTSDSVLEHGIAVVTMDDLRWARCDIKATSLLPNIVLRQMAADRDAAEAILVRDGLAMEGTSSSIFAIIDDTLITPPKSTSRLPGTTRDFILELAADEGVASEECEIRVESLKGAAEIWISSAAREVIPVTRLDGQPVGTGQPGTYWRRIYDRFQARKIALGELPA